MPFEHRYRLQTRDIECGQCPGRRDLHEIARGRRRGNRRARQFNVDFQRIGNRKSRKRPFMLEGDQPAVGQTRRIGCDDTEIARGIGLRREVRARRT